MLFRSTEHAARIALRTQQILAHETGIANTADPLAGSYFVERLTLDMEKGCWDYFERLDAMAIRREVKRIGTL